jgi:hypothetical protein
MLPSTVLVVKVELVPVTVKTTLDPARMTAAIALALALGEASTNRSIRTTTTSLAPTVVGEAELAPDSRAPSNAAGAGPSPVVAGLELQPNYSTT